MLGYATYELSQQLLDLTPQQRDAIARIVQHVYLDNQPLAQLLQGDDKICSESVYYRKGKLNKETGSWSRRGWHHQPEFTKALAEAARLAIAAQSKEEIHAMRGAVRKARMDAETVVDRMLTITRLGQHKDSINAAKVVWNIAQHGADDDQNDDSAEAADWWAAAEDDVEWPQRGPEGID